MHVFEISIENKNGCDPGTFLNHVNLVLDNLYFNGQIWKDRITIREGDGLRAYVRAFEKTSFQKKFCNRYFLDNRRELERMAGAKLKFDPQGVTADHAEPCRCKKHDYFVLQAGLLEICSPIICGNCEADVPLYRLPRLDDEEGYYSILHWVTNYVACDTLYMESGSGEPWGTKQMSDPNSWLSRDGRALCEKIEQRTGVPTYYYLCNYRHITRSQDMRRPCPLCGKEWLHETDWPERTRCDSCRIVSNLTSNAK